MSHPPGGSGPKPKLKAIVIDSLVFGAAVVLAWRLFALFSVQFQTLQQAVLFGGFGAVLTFIYHLVIEYLAEPYVFGRGSEGAGNANYRQT